MQNIFKNLTLSLFFASFSFTGCTSILSTTSNHLIAISPLDKEHIQVEYKLLASSVNLSEFYGKTTHQLRNKWKPLNHCGQISSDGILTQNAGCNSVSFSVPIDATFIDRVNPVAYPMNEEGVLIHTATFAIKAYNVTWKFSSPKGALIIDGTNRGATTSLNETQHAFINYTGVFLSYKKLPNNLSVIATQATPDKLKAGIISASQQISDYYKTTYPAAHFSPPMLFINNITQANSNGTQADVSSHRMIRFGFVNWQENQLADARAITAHEFAHTLQPSPFKSLDGNPIISEGGAEFIRWIAEYHLGWRDKNYLSASWSWALQQCLDASDHQPWQKIKDFPGYTPYACGLVAHTIALASRKNVESAEQTIGNFYTNALSNPTTDFAQAVECGNLNDCKATFLPMFFDNEKTLTDVINVQLNALGLVKEQTYNENMNNLTAISANALTNLMIEDCGGPGFWTKAEHFFIDAGPKCKSISNGLRVSTVEGISYFTEPLKAIAAQNKGCSTKHNVTLGTLDNQTITVACTKTFEKNYYVIDIDKLLALLDKRDVNIDTDKH